LQKRHFVCAHLTAQNQHIWSLIANQCKKPIEGSIPIGAFHNH
jgi:hypothetical protein